MNEQEMRDIEAPWPKTWDELRDFCEPLLAKESDDYGKAVYCISLAATAMFNFAGHMVGASGFQASCADLDVLRRTRGMNCGFQIVNYENALYPQYVTGTDENNAALRAIFPQIAPGLAKEAAKRLKERGETAHPEVRKHLERIAALATPEQPTATE